MMPWQPTELRNGGSPPNIPRVPRSATDLGSTGGGDGGVSAEVPGHFTSEEMVSSAALVTSGAASSAAAAAASSSAAAPSFAASGTFRRSWRPHVGTRSGSSGASGGRGRSGGVSSKGCDEDEDKGVISFQDAALVAWLNSILFVHEEEEDNNLL